MVKTLYITGRRNGKSSKARYEFLKNPESTAFITESRELGFHALGSKYRDHIYDVKTNLCSKLRGCYYTRFIVDEYLLIKKIHRTRLYEAVATNNRLRELLLFTSPDDLYPAGLLQTITEHKTAGIGYAESEAAYIKSLLKLISAGALRENLDNLLDTYRSIYYSYITDPDTIIIHEEVKNPVLNESDYYYHKETYHSEVLGRYIIEEDSDLFIFQENRGKNLRK